MSTEPDFFVQQLNDLNLAVELAPRVFYGLRPGSREVHAAVAAIAAVGSRIFELRKQIAADCAPWFDSTAFFLGEESAVMAAVRTDFDKIFRTPELQRSAG